jgi:putative membrane protein
VSTCPVIRIGGFVLLLQNQNGGYGYGYGWWAWLFWIIILVIIVWIIASLASRGRRRRDNNGDIADKETALDILKQRYARGEISKDQYEQMKKDIETRNGP